MREYDDGLFFFFPSSLVIVYTDFVIFASWWVYIGQRSPIFSFEIVFKTPQELKIKENMEKYTENKQSVSTF